MKAAVIGMGPHGRRLAKILQGMEGVVLDAVVDRADAALAWPELAPTVRKLRDTSELWRTPPELVCISTNGPSHAPLAIAAMEAGVRRVMVEKPMATSVADCERMILAAQRTGSRLSVNQSRRHDPLYRWLREQLASGRWGELRAVWIQRAGIGLGCLGTHYFDLVRYLAGREVERVSGFVDPFIGPNPRGAEFADPGGLVVMELQGRVRAVIAQIEDGAGPMSVELDLTGARVRVDEQTDVVQVIARDTSVKPGPGKPAKFIEETVPAGLSAKTDVSVMATGVLRELAGDGPLSCDASHGKASIEVLAAAYLSHAARGAPVALPLDASARSLTMSVT